MGDGEWLQPGDQSLPEKPCPQRAASGGTDTDHKMSEAEACELGQLVITADDRHAENLLQAGVRVEDGIEADRKQGFHEHSAVAAGADEDGFHDGGRSWKVLSRSRWSSGVRTIRSSSFSEAWPSPKNVSWPAAMARNSGVRAF